MINKGDTVATLVNTTLVDIPVEGKCVTRNGESDICRMTAELLTTSESSVASIGFVSQKLHRALHAGATITVTDLDKFCITWLNRRGFYNHALNGIPDKGDENENENGKDKDTVLELLKSAEAMISHARGAVLKSNLIH